MLVCWMSNRRSRSPVAQSSLAASTMSHAMPKESRMAQFKIGDQVERVGALIDPPFMRVGTITRVIPNEHPVDCFTEYEVRFDDEEVVTLFEIQLRSVTPGKQP